MAERPEETEAELDVGSEPISPAAAMAIGLHKGRRRAATDPDFQAFLRKQSRLIDLQTEHRAAADPVAAMQPHDVVHAQPIQTLALEVCGNENDAARAVVLRAGADDTLVAGREISHATAWSQDPVL